MKQDDAILMGWGCVSTASVKELHYSIEGIFDKNEHLDIFK